MNKHVRSLLLNVSVWVPLLGMGAQAQSAIKLMKVDVPFEFYVQGRPFPAGSYVVRRENSFVSLRDNNGRRLYVLTPNTLRSETAAAASKVVFFEYNGLHLLTQILWEGDKTGVEFIRKGREEEVARRIVPAKVERAEAGSRP